MVSEHGQPRRVLQLILIGRSSKKQLDKAKITLLYIMTDRGTDVVTFGRYKGMTIDEIRIINPNYLYYLHDSEFYKHSLPDLDDPVIDFGKYNGKTYKSVATTDPQYFDWLKRCATNIYTKAKISYVTGSKKKPKARPYEADSSIDSLSLE